MRLTHLTGSTSLAAKVYRQDHFGQNTPVGDPRRSKFEVNLVEMFRAFEVNNGRGCIRQGETTEVLLRIVHNRLIVCDTVAV
eukprot:3807275-Pyramimonas_sp.AAC.2